MVSIRPDWPKRRLRELKACLDVVGQDEVRRTAKLDKELSRPTDRELGVYVVQLELLTHGFGTRGTIELLSGSIESGWHDVARSLQAYLASFKIRAAMGFPHYSGCDTVHACLLLCTAIALQSEAVAKWLAELIVSSYQNQGPLKRWEYSAFEPLALRLACSVQGIAPGQLPRGKKLPDLYDRLVQAEDAQATQAALSQLALERVQLVSDAYIDYPPFQYSPFDLFPVEILAHLMVRYSGIPKFDFGVLESPLCDPPLPFPHEKDLLVDRVIARAKALLPIADVEWA